MDRRKHVDQLTEEEKEIRRAKRRAWYESRSPEYKEKLLANQRAYTARKKQEAFEKGERIRREYKATEEQKAQKRMRDAISKEKRMQEHQKQLEAQGLTGYQVCTRCTKAKPLSAFISRSGNRINVMCDECRTNIYASIRPVFPGFTAEFWFEKARRVNYLVLKTLRKTKSESTLFDLAESIEGSDLVKMANEQDGKCYYCGVQLTPDTVHIDHKTPLSRGGRNRLENICISCASCNRMKWTMDEQEFKKELKSLAQRLSCRYLDKEPNDNK